MNKRTFWGFTVPSVAVMLSLMVVPLVATIWLGFQRLTLRDLQNPEFIGLQNYRDLLTDPEFWSAARWTILLVMIVVPIQMPLTTMLAVMQSQRRNVH